MVFNLRNQDKHQRTQKQLHEKPNKACFNCQPTKQAYQELSSWIMGMVQSLARPLTLWRPLLPSGLSVRMPGCQKITNDGLTLSGTWCFIAVPIWQQWVSKG